MVVTVLNRSERLRYTGISAVGIGHVRKDLVLVPEDGTQPIVIGPSQWTRVEIDQVEQSEQIEEPPSTTFGPLGKTRSIMLDDD